MKCPPRVRALPAALCSLVPLLVLPALAAGQEDALPTLPPELQTVRAALDKYRDPIKAIHDGYLSTVGCIAYPHGGGHGEMQYAPGGMGVHFLNTSYISPQLDPDKPQVLIYEPDGGKLDLVAAEWFVPTDVAGSTRPTMFGRELDGPMEGHEPIMPAAMHHYDLHVWLWKDNPAGLFSPTNPALSCADGLYPLEEEAPKTAGGGGL